MPTSYWDDIYVRFDDKSERYFLQRSKGWATDCVTYQCVDESEETVTFVRWLTDEEVHTFTFEKECLKIYGKTKSELTCAVDDSVRWAQPGLYVELTCDINANPEWQRVPYCELTSDVNDEEAKVWYYDRLPAIACDIRPKNWRTNLCVDRYGKSTLLADWTEVQLKKQKLDTLISYCETNDCIGYRYMPYHKKQPWIDSILATAKARKTSAAVFRMLNIKCWHPYVETTLEHT